MIIPWGKHAGKELDTLPDRYLQWLANHRSNHDLRDEARHILGERGVNWEDYEPPEVKKHKPKPPEPSVLDEYANDNEDMEVEF